MKLTNQALLDYFSYWKDSANCYEQNAYEHLVDIKLLHDVIDQLKEQNDVLKCDNHELRLDVMAAKNITKGREQEIRMQVMREMMMQNKELDSCGCCYVDKE